MKIAVLAFGSLIKNPSGISLKENFKANGVALPLEFSRISSTGNTKDCLTLVIDEKNGTLIPSFYATSSHTDLKTAIDEFKTREHSKSDLAVGFIDLINHVVNSRALELYPKTVADIEKWAIDNKFDAVIWSNLRPNFKKMTGFSFSAKRATDYIRYMMPDIRNKAREHISNTNQTIQTPLRKRISQSN